MSDVANYAWVITRDVLENRAVTTLGPRNSIHWIDGEGRSEAARRLSSAKGRRRFRLLDGDGELYYEGVIVGGTGFEPLDDYGDAAGCVTILYNDNGKGWEPP